MERVYYEDIEVGLRFGGPMYTIEAGEMLEFARKWDPRPLHVDEKSDAAKAFGGITASGAYLTAIFTLLSQRARRQAGDHAVIAALGAEGQRIPNPGRAGDTLTYSAEIVSKRESESRSGAGIVRTQARLTNQDGAVVMECETVTRVEKRPGPD